MIIVKYCGGLGNQMYQYAIQVALQNRFPQQQFKADVSHYNLFREHNGFELENYFGLKFEYASLREVRGLYAGLVPGKWWRIMPEGFRDFIVHKFQWKYLELMEKFKPEIAKKTVKESDIAEKLETLGTGDWYLRGMWQNVKYFEAYQKEIIQAFHLSPEITEEEREIVSELSNGQAIAVHIRGGDFLKGDTFNLCTEDYYARALEYMPKLPLYVFTDDKAYANALLKNHSVKAYVSHRIEESIKDMYMMSRARYQIISNSTFSFWSGFLNANSNRIVCPQYAVKNKNGYSNASFKSDWIVIQNGNQ